MFCVQGDVRVLEYKSLIVNMGTVRNWEDISYVALIDRGLSARVKTSDRLHPQAMCGHAGEVFADIFKLSLLNYEFSTYFRKIIIIPIPKESRVERVSGGSDILHHQML